MSWTAVWVPPGTVDLRTRILQLPRKNLMFACRARSAAVLSYSSSSCPTTGSFSVCDAIFVPRSLGAGHLHCFGCSLYKYSARHDPARLLRRQVGRLPDKFVFSLFFVDGIWRHRLCGLCWLFGVRRNIIPICKEAPRESADNVGSIQDPFKGGVVGLDCRQHFSL